MKIILVNKFYYRRGGDCIYMLNLEQLLKERGHDVAVFSMEYPENLPTEWSRYFPSNMIKIKAFTRPFGSLEVKRKFVALLDDFKPDVVHLNNIHTQLSPIVAELAHDRGIKVIWTLHDLKLLCPRYDCLLNGKEQCEACFLENKRYCLKNGCIKNSKIASWIGYREAKIWNRNRLESTTDLFICPSDFIKGKMLQGLFSSGKLFTLSNFIDIEKCKKNNHDKEEYYCYVGRLSPEKGIETLINAANKLSFRLKVIGDGFLKDRLVSYAKSNIEFLGHKNWDEIKSVVGNAKFTVLPSECNENNPLSVIESLCLGTPVLGARIGGIPELIEEDVNGMTFESKNVDDLVDKIECMMGKSFDYADIARTAQVKYSSETYYQKLMEIYERES